MRESDLGIDRTVVTPWAGEAESTPATDESDTTEFEDGFEDDPLLGDTPRPSPAVSPAGSTTSSPTASADVHPTAASGPEAVQAVAAIGGHPLHPTFVPLPIGAFVGAFVSDIAYARTHDPFWARSARLLTAGGIATGILAGSLGAMDFTGRRQVRSHGAAWVHAAGNLTVLALGVVSESLRSRDERRAVERGALAISALSAAILGVTGWLGGELAYRARIGVTPD